MADPQVIRLFLVTPNLAHQPNPKRCMWKLAHFFGVVIKLQKVNADELTRVVIRATAKRCTTFAASLKHQARYGWKVEEIEDESDSRQSMYFDDAFISFEEGEVAVTPDEMHRGAGSSGRQTQPRQPPVNEVEVDKLSTASSATLRSEVEHTKRMVKESAAVARAAQIEAQRERQNAADAEGRAAAAARRAALAEEAKAAAEEAKAAAERRASEALKLVAELQAKFQQQRQ